MSESLLEQTAIDKAADGRFFKSLGLSSFVIEIVRAMPDIRAAAGIARTAYEGLPKEVADNSESAVVNELLDRMHRPSDDESLIRREGSHLASQLIAYLDSSGRSRILVGDGNVYWQHQTESGSHLCTSDEKGETIIHFSDYEKNLGDDVGSRRATVDDYCRLLIDMQTAAELTLVSSATLA